jgi:hypothetical protein
MAGDGSLGASDVLVESTRSRAQGELVDVADPPDVRLGFAVAATAAAIAFAVIVSLVRARRGTVDFWYDDSWVAMSARVPLSQAIHMGLTAPGFTIVARWWLGLRSGSIAWAQSFALIGFVASPIVLFVAARTAGAPRWAATTGACLTAVGPMLLSESSRVKQYTWEFAFSAAMIAVAAAIRRDGPTIRWTVVAAALIAVATIFSAAALLPSAVLFAVLVVALWNAARRSEPALSLRVTLGRAALVGVTLATAALVVVHPNRGLTDFWWSHDAFLGYSSNSVGHSPGATARQGWSLLRGFMDGFIGPGALVLVVVGASLAWITYRRWRALWWLLLAPLSAVGFSIAQRYPLATSSSDSRVEASLMPWIMVLLVLAITEIVTTALARGTAVRSRPLILAVVVVVAVALGQAAWANTLAYPGMHARGALQVLAEKRAGGPSYVANGDDPLNFAANLPVRIVTDHNALQGWIVAALGDGSTLRVLHLNSPDVAAQELEPACGHTAAIGGGDQRALSATFLLLDCKVLHKSTETWGTTQIDDDTTILSFAPAPPRP